MQSLATCTPAKRCFAGTPAAHPHALAFPRPRGNATRSLGPRDLLQPLQRVRIAPHQQQQRNCLRIRLGPPLLPLLQRALVDPQLPRKHRARTRSAPASSPIRRQSYAAAFRRAARRAPKTVPPRLPLLGRTATVVSRRNRSAYRSSFSMLTCEILPFSSLLTEG